LLDVEDMAAIIAPGHPCRAVCHCYSWDFVTIAASWSWYTVSF